ncbi:MAG TPA: PH domain-containing protein [Candidatus Levybacteria bacterium]|nr:PH domain-containing protein [Candidatus Levybacteria bacterium]
MNPQEKVINVEHRGKTEKIIVTHITIRQSISFLLLKLIVIEVIAVAGVIFLYMMVISASAVDDFLALTVPNPLTIWTFLLITLVKMSVVIFVIIQWLNEYYEITPKEVIHKSGLIYKKEDRHTLNHLGSIEIQQGIFGRIFNYGTLRLFNWALERNVELYLIHNPMKYHKILQSLLPEVDTAKNILREHVLEKVE